MSDQAQILRGLVEKREQPNPVPLANKRRRARTIAVTSGKGGVGKSNIALNLAIALKRSGSEVCLLDANLGLGNVDLLCGLNGYWNLAHVISGVRSLNDIVLDGPENIRVIPGASGLTDIADCPPIAQREILRQLEEIEDDNDFIIIDTGTGIHDSIRRFVIAADIVLLVTTPEPTSIADAYATVKALSACSELPEILTVVNQARSRQQAETIIERLHETARLFLRVNVGSAGFIPYDENVSLAVTQQRPLLVHTANSPAARSIERIGRFLKNGTVAMSGRGFFSKLWPSQGRVA